jgi:hypothetical protein
MMRCEDVRSELATPTDTGDAASLAEHLSRCPSCSTWADRSARLDRLWQMTQPAEPTPDVWDNLWSGVISSLDVPAIKEVVSPGEVGLRNGSANVSVYRSEPKSNDRARAASGRRRLAAVGLLGLAQAAAVLLVVGLAWRVFIPPRPAQNRIAMALPNVEIEEGHLVVIVADPQNLGVVDLTPKGMAGGDRMYVDWYGDERFFDWVLVYHEIESLASKPVVAMKE